jgi:hypothetical protein
MNGDGTSQKQITHDAANHDSPSWSPDGAKIALVSDANEHSVIYMMNVDGTSVERLTGLAADSIHPTWSADSSKVIYCCAPQKFRRVAHFPRSTMSLAVFRTALPTHRGRGVKSLPRQPSLPLYSSSHDGREPCAPVRIGRDGRSEGRSKMSRFDNGAGSDSTDR